MTSGLSFDMDRLERESLLLDLNLAVSDECFDQLHAIIEQIVFTYIDAPPVEKLMKKYPDLQVRLMSITPFLTLKEINSILKLVDIELSAVDLTINLS